MLCICPINHFNTIKRPCYFAQSWPQLTNGLFSWSEPLNAMCCFTVQQVKKGLLTLVVRTHVRVGALCSQAQEAQLCRSHSLGSTAGMARISADVGDYNYLTDNSKADALSSRRPAKPKDRIMIEIILRKGQRCLKISSICSILFQRLNSQFNSLSS